MLHLELQGDEGLLAVHDLCICFTSKLPELRMLCDLIC
jgi:hypothetical protein